MLLVAFVVDRVVGCALLMLLLRLLLGAVALDWSELSMSLTGSFAADF